MTPEKFLAQPNIYVRIQALMTPAIEIDQDTFAEIVNATVTAFDQYRREAIVAGCDQLREIESDVQS